MRLAIVVAALSPFLLARAQIPDDPHQRMLVVIARITELQQQRELDEANRAELLRLRAELDTLMRRSAELRLGREPEELPSSPPRPLSDHERVLRGRALAATRHTVLETEAGRWLRTHHDVTVPELILLDHPSVAPLPAFRCYVAKVVCLPRLPKGVETPTWHRVRHVLTVFDVEAGTVTIEQDTTPSNPDHALLASGKVRARDEASLERLHVAMALLRHASGGHAAIVEDGGTVSQARRARPRAVRGGAQVCGYAARRVNDRDEALDRPAALGEVPRHACTVPFRTAAAPAWPPGDSGNRPKMVREQGLEP